MYITGAVPNQRAKNKSLVGAFVDVQIKNRVLQLARSRSTTTSEIVCEALRCYLDSQRTSEDLENQYSAKEEKEDRAVEQRPDQGREELVEAVWLL